jgi:uncharacterized membrane protein
MWLHLLAAIVWIGGLAFISMVLAPLVVMTLALLLVRGLPA